MNKVIKENRLTQRDLEMIEDLIYKNGDDVAISVARSFERLERYVDSIGNKLHSRLGELEDTLTIIRDNKIT